MVSIKTTNFENITGDLIDASKEVAQFAGTIPFFIFSLLNHRIQVISSYQEKLSSYAKQRYVSDEEIFGNLKRLISHQKQRGISI